MNQIQGKPYPRHAQGPLIGSASIQHTNNTGVPLTLVAVAAMAMAGLSVQDGYDVHRPDLPPSSTSSMIVGVAETGASKSTAAKPFLQPALDFQDRMQLASEGEKHIFEAERVTWQAKCDQLRLEIRQAVAEGRSTQEAESELAKVLSARPEAPRVPQIILENATPAAVRQHLCTVWPSGMFISMDAGGLLNGTVGREFDMFTSGYDGDPIHSSTVTGGSMAVRSPRLACFLYTQPPAAIRYLKRYGSDALGSGFLSRVEWCVLDGINQGASVGATVQAHDAIAAYQARAAELLQESVERRRSGHGREAVGFTPSARMYFVDLRNRIRSTMSPGQPLHGLGGYGARVAERVARLACVIHVFNKLPGLISDETLFGAEQIIEWHTEHFIGLMTAASPQVQEAQDAQWLDYQLWLVARQGRMVRPADVAHLCPADWKRARSQRALHALVNTGRAQIKRWNRNAFVQVTSMPLLAGNSIGLR
jgi:hypothetical protein